MDDASDGEPIRLVPASQNQIRSARRLLRRKERTLSAEFLAEGPQAVREALSCGGVVSLLVSQAGQQSHHDLVRTAWGSGVNVSLLSDRDMAGLADMAVNDPASFSAIVNLARAALPTDVNAPREDAAKEDAA